MTNLPGGYRPQTFIPWRDRVARPIWGLALLLGLAVLIARYGPAITIDTLETVYRPEMVTLDSPEPTWLVTMPLTLLDHAYRLWADVRPSPPTVSPLAAGAYLFGQGLLLALTMAGLSYVRGWARWMVPMPFALGLMGYLPDLLAQGFGHRLVGVGQLLAGVGLLLYYLIWDGRGAYWQRALLFLAILWGGWAVATLVLGVEALPLMQAYGQWLPMGLAILFVIQAGYGAAHFLFLSARSSRGINPLISVTIMLLFMIGNLLLTYFRSRGVLGDGLAFHLDPILVLVLAGGVGYAALETYSDQGAHLLDLPDQAMAPFYPAWFGLCMLVALRALMTDNTALVEVFEDVTALSVASVCFSYLVYLWLNFAEPLWAGAPVERVFFSPKYLQPYGILITTATALFIFVSQSELHQWRQQLAGYWIAVGDAHYGRGDWQDADLAYGRSLDEEPLNFRANWMSAQLALAKNDLAGYLQSLRLSAQTKARPSSYVAMASLHRDRGQDLEAILALEEGRDQLGHDPALLLVLADLYAHSTLDDSTRSVSARLAAQAGTGGQYGLPIRAQVWALASLGYGEMSDAQIRANNREPAVAVMANMDLTALMRGEGCAASRPLPDLADTGTMAAPFFWAYNRATRCPEASDTLPRVIMTRYRDVASGYEQDALWRQLGQDDRDGRRSTLLERAIDLAESSEFNRQEYWDRAAAWAIQLQAWARFDQIARRAQEVGSPLQADLIEQVDLWRAGPRPGQAMAPTTDQLRTLAQQTDSVKASFLWHHAALLSPAAALALAQTGEGGAHQQGLITAYGLGLYRLGQEQTLWDMARNLPPSLAGADKGLAARLRAWAASLQLRQAPDGQRAAAFAPLVDKFMADTAYTYGWGALAFASRQPATQRLGGLSRAIDQQPNDPRLWQTALEFAPSLQDRVTLAQTIYETDPADDERLLTYALALEAANLDAFLPGLLERASVARTEGWRPAFDRRLAALRPVASAEE